MAAYRQAAVPKADRHASVSSLWDANSGWDVSRAGQETIALHD